MFSYSFCISYYDMCVLHFILSNLQYIRYTNTVLWRHFDVHHYIFFCLCLTLFSIDFYSFVPMAFDLNEDLASENSSVNSVAEIRVVEIDLNAEPDIVGDVGIEESAESNIVVNRFCVWWTDFCWTNDGCMYRFRNFTVYMVLFYGLDLKFLQYTRLNWKFTVLFENFTVYKIQFYSIYFTIYKIQLKILLYTRFNFIVYKIQL